MNFRGIEAFVHRCEDCGEKFIGGRPQEDPDTKQWMTNHNRSRQHIGWETKRKLDACTHAGKSSIVEVGGTDRWYRRCDECWRYLYATDAHGNAVQSESL